MARQGGSFIPAAEQNGLIIEFGDWVLRTACRQAAQWQDDWGTRAPDKVAVNVSARRLARPGFAAVVARALAETGLPVPDHQQRRRVQSDLRHVPDAGHRRPLISAVLLPWRATDDQAHEVAQPPARTG